MTFLNLSIKADIQTLIDSYRSLSIIFMPATVCISGSLSLCNCVISARGVRSCPKRVSEGVGFCFSPALRHLILPIKVLIEDCD